MNRFKELKPKTAGQIATLVVVNIIYWMVMLTAIGLGAIYLNRCPVQPKIPIYLIVMGAASIGVLCLSYLMPACGNNICNLLTGCCGGFAYMFIFGWFIAGTHWIYSVYPPGDSPGTDLYCHKTVYQFAFIVTTLQWIAIALVLTYACCFALISCCVAINTGDQLIPNRTTFYGATSNFREPVGGGEP